MIFFFPQITIEFGLPYYNYNFFYYKNINLFFWCWTPHAHILWCYANSRFRCLHSAFDANILHNLFHLLEQHFWTLCIENKKNKQSYWIQRSFVLFDSTIVCCLQHINCVQQWKKVEFQPTIYIRGQHDSSGSKLNANLKDKFCSFFVMMIIKISKCEKT